MLRTPDNYQRTVAYGILLPEHPFCRIPNVFGIHKMRCSAPRKIPVRLLQNSLFAMVKNTQYSQNL